MLRNVLLVTLLTATGIAGAATREVNQTIPITPDGRFSLSNVNGEITVEGWDASEIQIIATIHADTQKRADAIEIAIDAGSDRVRVETKHPESKSWFGDDHSGSVDYQVLVPRGVTLDSVSSVNGDVELSGVFAAVELSTVNGDVKAFDLESDVTLDTVNGDVEATFLKLDGGQRVKMDSVNGDLELYVPQSASFEVSADSVHGDIRTDFGLKTDGGWVGKEMHGTVNGGDARISLDTVNGGIKVRASN